MKKTRTLRTQQRQNKIAQKEEIHHEKKKQKNTNIQNNKTP